MVDHPQTQEIDDAFGRLIQDVDKLIIVEDPDEEPYRSKYEARRLINEWQQKPSSSSLPLLEEARSAFRLGKIGLDTEEPHEAEVHLTKAVDIFFPGLVKVIQEQTGDGIEEDQLIKGGGNLQTIQAPAICMSPALTELVEKQGIQGTGEEAMEALNLLGILWSSRDQLRRALLYLMAAKEIYTVLDVSSSAFDKQRRSESATTESKSSAAAGAGGGAISPSPDSEAPLTGGHRNGTFRRQLDAHYTHTLFYLAQVYGALQDADMSAFYCQQTLERQLEWEVDLDVLGWISNCMSLVDYFVNREGDLYSAANCLQACEVLLKKSVSATTSTQTTNGEAAASVAAAVVDPEEDKVSFTRGDLARRWAAIYTFILRVASERKEHVKYPDLVDQTSPVSPQSQNEVHFATLELTKVSLPDTTAITTYDKARALFLNANKYLDEAKGIFVLDGYVTDHANLLREGSRLYRYLSSFETDEKRRQAMYLRRAAILQPLVDELNPKAYEALHKMLSFELGEIFLELVDMKIGRIEAKLEEDSNYHVKRSEMDKCNEYCQHAVQSFEHFCEMYKRDDDADPSRKVWSFEKDDLRLILRAHFHLARLYGRYDLFGTGPQRIEASKKSLVAYESLHSFANRELRRWYGGGGGGKEKGQEEEASFFAEEMIVIQDMMEMLPSKISKMHYSGQTFSR